MEWVTELIERDRGFLTSHDRMYLLDRLDEQLESNAEYQKRYQIRNRIQNALLDFQIIINTIEGRDLDHLFQPIDEWAREARLQRERHQSYPDPPEMAYHWMAMFQFFVYNTLASGVQDSARLAEWVIEESISRSLRQRGFNQFNEYHETNVSVNWEIRQRYRLLHYINYIESQLPQEPTAIEQELFHLYKQQYLPYSLAVYLHNRYLGE